MLIDAIVLAGGRSLRLGSLPKSDFAVDGITLLQRTLDAAGSARRIVVVGPEPSHGLPDGVLHTREVPPFSGPVAGIAAGMEALARASETMSDVTLVLACDMPHIDRAIPLLVRRLAEHPDSDGVIAIDSDHHRQPLAAGYRTTRLTAVLERCRKDGPLDSMPVFRLINGLTLISLDVPVDATSDVDTWDDAERLGAVAPPLTTDPVNATGPMYSTAQEAMTHE